MGLALPVTEPVEDPLDVDDPVLDEEVVDDGVVERVCDAVGVGLPLTEDEGDDVAETVPVELDVDVELPDMVPLPVALVLPLVLGEALVLAVADELPDPVAVAEEEPEEDGDADADADADAVAEAEFVGVGSSTRRRKPFESPSTASTTAVGSWAPPRRSNIMEPAVEAAVAGACASRVGGEAAAPRTSIAAADMDNAEDSAGFGSKPKDRTPTAANAQRSMMICTLPDGRVHNLHDACVMLPDSMFLLRDGVNDFISQLNSGSVLGMATTGPGGVAMPCRSRSIRSSAECDAVDVCSASKSAQRAPEVQTSRGTGT